jgi:disulfide bond formation protein DsbB
MEINKENLHKAILFLIVIALGLFIINQFLEFRYSAELLMQPCDLCLKLNPQIRFEYASSSFPNLLNYYSNLTVS